MEYRVLGPLEVRADDGPLPLGGEKQRALLALLLLDANRVVSRERLIDALWGDEPPETAVQTVQVYVSRLRKLLPPETLVTRAPGYVLAAAPETIDLQRFQRLAADARGADPERASGLLREALELWRGPALSEFGEEPFAQAEAGRLEDLRLAAFEERIEADLSLGRHADLVGELEMLVAANPHRERLQGQLMLALYRSGRQAEALEAYRSARAALDELGIEPSGVLRGLEKAILVQDAALAAPLALLKDAQPLPGPLVPEPSFPFVGRESELAALSSMLERAQSGEGGLVLLSGEPGAGKTRLARELAHAVAAAGVLVCYGASDAAVTVPYQPLREWLDFLLGVCDRATLAECVGDGGELIARIAPAFATLAGKEAPPPGADATIDRYLLQTAVAEFVRQLSRRRPLLLVIEDIHWSDSETLLLLARLARMAPESRMLVVATLRQGAEIQRELAETLANLSRLEGVTRVALGNLTSDDVGAFVRDSTDAEASVELVAAIDELSNGTPLLLCELWRELVARGAVAISNAHATLARPVAELRGSQRIDELVEQRLARLSPETAAMLELAAVTGPRFELRLLAQAAQFDRGALVASVEEAVAIGLLEELPEPEPVCRFTHELVRRAIYDRIRRVRRPELHLQVGEALERTHADPAHVLPELAHHFTLAAPVAGAERGVAYNLRAAAAATATFAYDEAAARLSSALELGIVDPGDRARVQGELGNLLWLTGRVGEAEAILTASLDAATSLEERGLAARALVHLSHERLSSDPGVGPAEIVSIAEEAIGTFERLDDSLGLAEAESLLGHAFSRAGRTEESFAALERALEHADAVGNQILRREVIASMAMAMCDRSTLTAEDAIGRLEELRSSTRNDPVLDAGLRRILALGLAMAGRFDEAREHILVSSAVLDSAEQTQLSIQTRWPVAEAKELAGDLAGAEQELVAQFDSLHDARGEGSEARALRASAHLALLSCDRGDWDKAAEYLSYGHEVDRSAPVEGKVYTVFRLAARGRVAAARGDGAEGLELAQLAVEVAERSRTPNYTARAWLALAEVQRANGQTAEADDAVANALRLYEAKGNVAAAARLKARLVDSPLERA